ncbi:hypothetical protein CK203_039434 [Vitis vinifera]|uniref:Uncharacterized protein n=1 Tax=Vitis vinifera TaxID=29760 RepID=A0A438I7F4_VITVI|nr:hypothetical protein CK203_039434 [Vitis vinifera]
MVTAPPIEGNSDCRARPFPSELYFNIEVMQQQLDLWDSFRLLQSFDGRQGILEARQIAEALHILFHPEDPTHFRQWYPISQRDMSAFYREGLLEILSFYVRSFHLGCS